MPTQKKLHDWMEVFIGLGVISTIAFLVIPPMVGRVVKQEIIRYQECQVVARKDCEPSMVWRIYDIALVQSGAINLTKSVYQQEIQDLIGSGRAKLPLRTSEAAAMIEASELVGLNPGADGFYRPKGGETLTIKSTITGAPDDVAIYLVPKGVETAGIPEKITVMKGDGTLYTATVLIPNGYVGELEIRATGPDVEQAQLYFDIAAE